MYTHVPLGIQVCTKIHVPYEPLILPIHATCASHLILLNLTSLIQHERVKMMTVLIM